MTEIHPDIGLHQSAYGHLDLMAKKFVLDRGLVHSRQVSWNTDIEVMPPLPGKVLGSFLGEDEEEDNGLLIEVTEELLLNIALDEGRCTVMIYGKDAEDVRAQLATIQQLIPRAEPEEGTIPATFWSQGEHGATRVGRRLNVPKFDEIGGNYDPDTWAALEELRGRSFEADLGGKLLLWHGPPGTGKTSAIRGLLQAWSSWCEMHYVIDPENLFGGRADYLINVLLAHSSKEWRLIILEDTGELLDREAKRRTGQGLSRLLNICDGLIGQGLKLLVLITTNEDLQGLHPAVTRDGRCAANIQFRELAMGQAVAWAEQNGLDPELVKKEKKPTLARLYALKHDSKPAANEEKAYGSDAGQYI